MQQEQIEQMYKDLKKLEPGSKEYDSLVTDITKLTESLNDMTKFRIELEEKARAREDENAIKVQAMEEEKKDRKWKNGIAVAGIAIPSALTVWGVLKSLKFEETGIVGSTAGRTFMNKILNMVKK